MQIKKILLAGFVSAVLGSAFGQTPMSESAPQPTNCPKSVADQTRCWQGVDSASAPYFIAMPGNWSGVLVVHAHGGPGLAKPTLERSKEDLVRWAITVNQGHAWVGSAFSQGGFAVKSAAEDSERVRKIFIQHIAKPKRTVLHGQSWGAMVATKAGEMFPKSWDGILLTSGVVAGPITYDFRMDLRAIYQALCGNHPKADEASYELSLGQPAQTSLKIADVASRADECLGVSKSKAWRTAQQQQKLTTIATVLRIPEASVLGHLNWATFTMADIVHKRLGGKTPFANQGVQYQGSSDDAALNRSVPRFAPDPQARARFVEEADHSGKFKVPVLTAHGVNDSIVFVEGSSVLLEKMRSAGNEQYLVQTFVNSSEHGYWGDAYYPPLFEAILAWISQGMKPTAQSVAKRCIELRNEVSKNGDSSECQFLPDYKAADIHSRIYQRSF